MAGNAEMLARIYARTAYCTVDRACEYLGVSERSFYRWLAFGKISYVTRTPGGHIRIDQPTLLRIEGELLRGELYGEPCDSNQLTFDLPIKREVHSK